MIIDDYIQQIDLQAQQTRQEWEARYTDEQQAFTERVREEIQKRTKDNAGTPGVHSEMGTNIKFAACGIA